MLFRYSPRKELLDKFDFDGDKKVTIVEFIKYFVVKILFGSESILVSEGVSFIDQIILMKQTFSVRLHEELTKLERQFLSASHPVIDHESHPSKPFSLPSVTTGGGGMVLGGAVPPPLPPAEDLPREPLPEHLQRSGQEVTYVWHCEEIGRYVPWPGRIAQVGKELSFAIPVSMIALQSL